MTSRFGAFLNGASLSLKARSGGRVVLESNLDRVLIKTHNAAATVASQVTIESIEPVVTSGNTATAVKTIPVAVDTAVHGVVRIVGKKTGAADSYAGESIFGFVNNGGTTAAIATATNRAHENSAGTPAVTVVADDSADTLVVKVAGIAAESWTWTGYIEYQTITYA